MDYTIIKKTDLPRSSIEIEAEISWEKVEKHRNHAVEHLNDAVEVPGFRKGKVPADVLVKRFGSSALTEEMAEHAVNDAAPKLILAERLHILGRPEIQITEIEEGKPLRFTMKAALMPDVELPNYMKIAKDLNASKKDPEEVSDGDIEKALKHVRESISRQEGKGNADPKQPIAEADLPPVDETFAKKFNAESVEALKKTIKENLTAERKQQSLEKHRIAISEKIIEGTKVDLPEVLIESELSRIESQFRDDIDRFGVKFDDYLTHAKKTIEDLRKDWRPDAEKRAKLQLALNKIADAENVRPNEKAVEAEVKHLTDHYKDANPERARIYVETILTNEGVYQLLESQK